MREIRLWDVFKFAILVTITVDGISRLVNLACKNKATITFTTETNSKK